ncbi:MAG: creatininase family protein [Halobacteria archaeon]
MLLGELSYDEVENYVDRPVLFPLGSTEQHGRHAPLSTDSFIAEAMATHVGEELDVLTLPTLEVGLSQEHRNFDGALYVDASTYRTFLLDLVDSLREFGVETVVFVNGHGGNIGALGEVCRRVSRQTDTFATEWTWWRSVDHGMGHAGFLETSLALYLKEELVDLNDGEDGVDSWGRYVEGSTVLYDVDEFSESGVVGSFEDASVDAGEDIFDEATDSLVRLVEWLDENKSGEG